MLVLDEVDDAVSMLRHVWLGVSFDLAQLAGWIGAAAAPGLLVYIALL